MTFKDYISTIIFTSLFKIRIFFYYKYRDFKTFIFPIFKRVPYPENIIIETGNICNLKCPLCPTGLNLIKDKAYMNFDIFKKIVIKFPKLSKIELYNWGEPFLNSDIFKMIAYCKSKSIKTVINTNFSFTKDDLFYEKLANVGLDFLTISLDGASQETYCKYRVGGNFDTVINNIKKLSKAKKKNEATKPIIIWKFIVNSYNEHEIESAQKMANDLGIEFQTAFIGLAEDILDIKISQSIKERQVKWLPKNPIFKKEYYRKNSKKKYYYNEKCPYLFNHMLINHNGDVYPCCFLTQPENSFGNILKQPLKDIWHNEKYMHSRALFKTTIKKSKIKHTICNNCMNYKKLRQCN